MQEVEMKKPLQINMELGYKALETKRDSVVNSGWSAESFTLEQMLRHAMRTIIAENYLSTSEEECFRASVGAVLAFVKPDTPDYERLSKALADYRLLGHYAIACAAGLDIDVPDNLPVPSLPLYIWWEEIRNDTKAKVEFKK